MVTQFPPSDRVAYIDERTDSAQIPRARRDPKFPHLLSWQSGRRTAELDTSQTPMPFSFLEFGHCTMYLRAHLRVPMNHKEIDRALVRLRKWLEKADPK